MNKLTKWVIDPQHSEIEFKVKHLMITNVKGTFKEYRAQIFTEGNEFMNAEIEVWIDPSSVYTGSADRDKHLTGPDFFDVENHKQITFKASAYEMKKEKEHYIPLQDLSAFCNIQMKTMRQLYYMQLLKYFLKAGFSGSCFLISRVVSSPRSTSSFSINCSASFCQSFGFLPGVRPWMLARNTRRTAS